MFIWPAEIFSWKYDPGIEFFECLDDVLFPGREYQIIAATRGNFPEYDDTPCRRDQQQTQLQLAVLR